MAQSSRTFRIFVSSTFDDLKEERNALQEQVFPRLRELCMQHGARFQAIDLRWGVSEEAAFDQQTINICLGEIERCRRITPRPNFVVLLGDRYGWRPLPPQIVADEFEEICQRISVEEQRRLREWYVRDDNAVPPEYCLKPREGEYEGFEKWEATERDLYSILLKAVQGMPLEAHDRIKYEASATEQEIAQGALRVADAPEHVFCFFRTIRNSPQDASAKDFVDLDASGGPDTEAAARRDELKSRLRNLLPGNIHEYEAEWTGSGVSADHLDKLCDDVFKALSRIIEAEIQRLEEVKPLEKEMGDHEAFGEDRARFFIGRAGILKTIDDYVGGTDGHPLAVWGVSGSGKSALMARAVQQARGDHPGAEVIVRFIGATPGSSDIRSLLESLCRQISRRYGADESAVPAGYRELVEEFPKRLALVTAQRPLIVFLDALDQLSDANNARGLVWLPADLPEHVRLILSALPGECLSALENKLPATSVVELEPMPPAEGRQLLDLWLEDAARTVQDHQHEEVLGKFGRNGLPLYLKLAFEESRRWKSYTADTVLSPDIPGVIRDLFGRLSSEANHGEMLVSRSLGYVVAAKNGLSEDELLDVLSLDEGVFQDFLDRARHEPPERRLPVVLWSRLYFDLEPYLTERSADGVSLMTFYHRQLGEVAAQEYLTGAAKQERHRSLADYFERRGYDYSRTLQELAYHLYQFALESGDCQRLYELVEDKSFKRRQLQHSGRPEPIVLNISYALDLAVRHSDPVQLIHFSMMRVNLTGEFYKTSLYRFVETARPAPELARDVVGLVSNPTLRRMGLVLLAWLFNKEEGQREFVRELIEDAARIGAPATVAQASALLEMIRDLYCSRVDEATGLLKSIPNCPVRQTYRRAWERGHEQIRALAAEMGRTEADVPTSTGEEVAEFNKMQSFVGELERRRFLRSPPMKLEDRLAELFGPSGVSDAYFLLATEQIHTGHFDAAAMLINRGIYVTSAFPLPAIRTLAALVEAFGATGNRELAAEHDDRIRVLAKGLERAAKTEHELGRLADMRSELRIAMDRAAHTWRPPGSSRLFEGSIAEQLPHGTGREVDLLTSLSSARQLLAQGHTRPVPAMLQHIIERVGQGEYEAESQAILVSAYALAHACEEGALASACISRLNAEGLHPEALYLPGEASPQAARVFATLVVSDPRCVASVSLCLRLAGFHQRLLEFAQVANAVGAGVETLDAVLSQVVRAPGVQPAGLRRVSEDILSTARFLQIPSGLGWYYYPGIMLTAAWPGIIFSCVGFWSAIKEPQWIIFGLALAAAGLVGGLLDLLVWRRVRLWERPEISRRWTAEIASIATLATLWGAVLLMRPVLTPMDSLMAVGAPVPVVLSLFLGVMMALNGLLFAPLSSRFIRVGTIASTLIGAILGVIFAVFGSDLFPTSLLRGMFLGGVSLIALGLNILPKRAAVVRHFGSRGDPDDGDMELSKEGRAYVS